MSRSYKKPYTKSKAVSKSCRCNGGCAYCLANRMHKHKKQLPKLEEGIVEYEERYDEDHEDYML